MNFVYNLSTRVSKKKKSDSATGIRALSLIALPGNVICYVRVISHLDISVTVIKLANDECSNAKHI